MNLARVIGTVHATTKDPGLLRAKLLVCRPIDAMKRPQGLPFVAVDTVGAGEGEIVYFTTAFEAIMPWRELHPEVKWSLIDSAIVGIVDRIDLARGGAGR